MPVTGRAGAARGVPMPEAFGLLQGVGGSMPPVLDVVHSLHLRSGNAAILLLTVVSVDNSGPWPKSLSCANVPALYGEPAPYGPYS